MTHQSYFQTNKKVFSREMEVYATQCAHLMSREAMMNQLHQQFSVSISLSQLKNAYVRLGLHAKKGSTGKRSKIGQKNKTVRGFTRIKTKSGWKLEHVALWESEYGPLPINHYIIFIDGNKENFIIDNLACVNRREYAFFKRLKKEAQGIDSPLLLLLSRLKAKIIERELCRK